VTHPLLLTAPHRRLVVGHRGNSAHAPENTLESFRQAVALSVDALELDVRITADGAVVVMHDPTLARTTDRTGAVEAMRLAEIREADAGARFTPDRGLTFPYRGRGIVAPTLDEVLRELPGVPLLIEIKTATAAGEVRRVIEASGAEGRCVVASFVDRALDPFRGSSVPLGGTPTDIKAMYWSAALRRGVARVAFQCLSIPLRHKGIPLPVSGMVRALEPLGVPVHVWTVDRPAVARALWSVGVRGVLTNDPAAMLRARDDAARDEPTARPR
jgi:glycerophosphoryl diester phosphodiesterase